MAPENSSLSPKDSDQKANSTEADSIKQIQGGGVMASEEPPKLQDSDQKAMSKEEDSIKQIQTIVESLQAIFSRGQKPKLTESQSTVVPTTQDTATTGEHLPRTQSAPPNGLPKAEESKESIDRLERNLCLLDKDVDKVRKLNKNVADEVERQIIPLKKLLNKVEKQSVTAKLTKGMKKDVEDINKKIFKLMCEVPLLPNKRSKPGGLDSDAGDGDNNGKGIFCLPAIHANDRDLKTRVAYRYVKVELEKLKVTPLLQICLLSFGVFPENQEVNRTMLMYWWIGENILPDIRADNAVKNILKDFTREILPDDAKPPGKGIPPDEEKPPGKGIPLDNAESKKNVGPHKDGPEDVVKAILNYFVERKLIEAVENKRKVEPNSYKMNPFVHSSLVFISKEIGLFDMYRKADKPTMKKSGLNKVCLVEGSSSQAEAKANKMKADAIETVFNVSERFPDFTFKWFSEEKESKNKVFRNPLKNIEYPELKVFYLGRWERTAKRHIEIENPEHMKYLKHMTKLRLLSFQGISRIERLDDAVCKLHELIILDLRACYNLEKLPDKLNSLKKLIYLDITDCYMIDRMPKRLSWLVKLEVLKGFVVSDAQEDTVCTLIELQALENLRKLSITINNGEFTVNDLFLAIEGFPALEKLKVAWGGMNEHRKKDPGPNLLERTATFFRGTDAPSELEKKEKKEKKETPKNPPTLPKTLKKLDLQCFPDSELPPWLKPNKLVDLEKLYIKGGKELTGFGTSLPPEEPTKCNVKILRLKFLPRLQVEWRDLKELYFPKLEFLDKYQCPQVSLCPCDGIGIWRIPEKHQV